MKAINEMELKIKSLSVNEGFARSAVSAFCVQANINLDELTEIKTAVSEAVTNCVVHAYPNTIGDIKIIAKLFNDHIYISVEDFGVGIEDIERAKEPFYTSKPEQERSGMGFTVMESFMDNILIKRNRKNGVIVVMEKYFTKLQDEILNKINA